MLVATVFAASVLLARGASADEPPQRRAPPRHALIGGGLVGLRAVRDDILVPLASTGPSLDMFGRFLGTLGGGIVDAELRVGMATVFDRGARPGVALSRAMRLGYLHVVRANEDWSIAVGPVVAWETDVFWLAKWDSAHAYWIGHRWLGPSARAWRQVATRLRLDVSGELALVGLEARPPAYRANKQDALTHLSFYFGEVDRGAKVGWLGDWQALKLAVDLHFCERSAAVPTGWGLGFETRLAHSDSPAMAFAFESAIRLERAWGLP